MSAPEPKISPVAPVLLLAFSLGECLLSVFQWMELLVVRSGGRALCSINEVMNCEAVWSSSFARRIHGLTQLPVAGLGLVWGLTAFGLSALLVHRMVAQKDPRIAVAALRATSAVALLSCITFGVAAARLGNLCLTCLGTYALVIAFSWVAARGLPGPLFAPVPQLRRGMIWAGGLALASYLALLGPGMMTSESTESSVDKLAAEPPKPQPTLPSTGSRLEAYLASLAPAEQQDVSQSLAIYKSSPTPPGGIPPARFVAGPTDAPVKIVEFTDVRCPHCRRLEETLKALRRATPAGSFSVEPRAFPLDGECNEMIAFTDGTHVRCTAAKALICLEGHADYWDVRDQLFAEQENLSVGRVLEIASAGSMGRAAMEQCVANPDTTTKLRADEAFAMQFRPEGTPLVLINGRQGTAVPAFLYAMALTGGNADSPEFARLAAPGAGRP